MRGVLDPSGWDDWISSAPLGMSDNSNLESVTTPTSSESLYRRADECGDDIVQSPGIIIPRQNHIVVSQSSRFCEPVFLLARTWQFQTHTAVLPRSPSC